MPKHTARRRHSMEIVAVDRVLPVTARDSAELRTSRERISSDANGDGQSVQRGNSVPWGAEFLA
jgi:hypothetical protein